MVSGSLARRYARALMQIGIDHNTYEALGREVRGFANAMRISDELAATLSNPAFPRPDRQRVVEALLARLGASVISKNFILLLLDRERLGSLPDISRELDRMIDEKVGRVAAEVTSAEPLSPAQLTQLKSALEQLSGKKVEMKSAEDPALLGGVIAKLGDVVYDGSLRTQLKQLRGGYTLR